jgi:hypothetical protein
LIPNVTDTTGLSSYRNDNGNADYGNNEGLEGKEPLQLVWRNKQDGKLKRPEDEMGDELVRADSSIFREGIRDVPEGWPDSTDTLKHGLTSSPCLNCMPEQGSYCSSNNGKSREVKAKR